jgi:membrane-associated protein
MTKSYRLCSSLVFGHDEVLITRFFPVVRALIPFVAGMASMRYRRFISFNVVGGFLLESVFLFASNYFGDMAFVHENLVLILLAITLVSFLPPVLVFLAGCAIGWIR